ncbi:MAG TPA: cyanophycin synthetase, partial [Candidatus Manganitrophaceae bacterium]
SYFSAKSRLFADYLRGSSKGRKFAVIHGGDPRGRDLLEKIRRMGFEVVSYGRSREWDVRPVEVEEDLNGLRGKIGVRDEEISFSSPLIGPVNLENILGAVGVGFALGLPKNAIAEGIARLASVPGRLERIKNSLGIAVLVDYAHTPDALGRVIFGVRPLTRGRLIVLFGCGGDRDRGKRPLMGEIAARLADLVILTSDNPRSEEPLKIIEEIEDGVRKTGIKKFQISNLKSQISDLRSEILNLKSYVVEPDRRAAICLALRLARAGDLVVIAGKGHEDYQILGPKRIHFDDREVAREELERLSC